MNPNKKDNSAWILCPSKSFPGKFYYFNVLNGEAAWSLNDADQKERKDLQKADKFHSFPEPLGPPAESPTTNVGLTIQKSVPNIVRRFNNVLQTTPTFGQATFPTYISNVDPYMQNLLWTPVVPMFPRPWQTQGNPSCETDRGILVQTCDIPLSKRFTNYEPKTYILEPSSNTQFGQTSRSCDTVKTSSNLFSNSHVFGQMIHNQNDPIIKLRRPRTQSESDSVVGTFCNNNEGSQIFDMIGTHSNVEPIQKVKRQRTLSESDSVIFEKPKCDLPNSIFNSNHNHLLRQNGEFMEKNIKNTSFVLRKSIFNPNQINTGHLETKEKDNQIKKNTNDVKNSSLGNLKRNEWEENKKDDSLGNLDENDLRHTLVKKRKSGDLGINNHVKENQYKVPTIHKVKEPVKKRVMFDIDSTEGSSEAYPECDDDHPPVTIQTLRGLVDKTNGRWYIAVDSRVLLDDCDFIEKFVKLDAECRLFVPHVVKCEIEEFCFGDCRGQQRVIVARQLTRKLTTLPQHIVVQPPENEDKIFTKMSTIVRILNSCIEILHQNNHVVLVTDDSVLYEKAKSLKIHCFKLQEIKDGASKPQGVNPQPIKITLKNPTTQNLFSEDNNPYSNIYRKISVDGCKKTVTNDTVKNCDVQTDIKITTDANTSPIKFEETTVERKEKSRDYLNFNYDSDSDATVISKSMEKLLIKDKNSNFLHKNSNNIKLDDRKTNSFVFQIKNKKNIVPQKELILGQIQNSKKECVSTDQKQKFLFQIQNSMISGQKEFKTTENSETFSLVEQFKKSIEDKLKQKFKVKSKFMEENIRSNINEWICTFRQIMEYALSEHLQQSPLECPPGLPPPWSLSEGVTCVRGAQAAQGGWKVAAVADQMALLLLNNCCKRGELKPDIKPEEFLRVFGYGAMLLELLPDSPPLYDGRRLLREMYSRMLLGSEDVDLVRTPVSRRDDGEEPIRHNFAISYGAMLLELLPDSPPLYDGRRLLREMYSRMLQGSEDVDLVRTTVSRRDDGEEPIRHNYPKKSSEIIQYLKNHFPAWHDYVETTHEITTQDDKKIVRTFGRNLNLLTIDKSKSLTMRESPNKTNNNDNASSPEINLSENTLIHSQSTIKLDNSTEPKVIRIFDTSNPFDKKKVTQTENVIMTPKHGNTFDDRTETAGPKVVRNIKLIDEFEKKLKNKANEEGNSNAESFSLSDVSLCTSIDGNNDNFEHNNDRYDSVNDKNSFNDNNKEQSNDLDKPNDSSTNDSGFVNETDTYTLVQTFLSEISGSMKLIYSFIDDSMAEFRKKELEVDKKKSIFDKASVTQLHLSGIIYKLKCIVQRESDEVTPLKEIILKADMLVLGDIRLMKYRQVVMKCLEQAQLLENALKMLLGVTEGNYDVTCFNDRQTFLNIFE